MKIILYCLITISIYAQDSTKVMYQSNLNNNLPMNVTLAENASVIPKKPLFLLSSNRKWQNASLDNINNTINASSIIKFKKKKPNFIDSDLFLIVVGSAVAFGATAAYYKLESDANYEKYLETNDKKYLDKTDKQDLYSGIALGALEINFGFLIYKFLTD